MARLSIVPPRVFSLCKRLLGRGAVAVAEVGVAEIGVADGGWPGSLLAALEGDGEGCWVFLTPFVCTSGTEGFFILGCAPAGLEAITAAMVVDQ